MSTGQESNVDIIAVACVVEASLLLASEWSRVQLEYVLPLLRRLDELHPSHQFRLAFVTYGAADTRPQPLICRRFFAPLSQIRKELGEDPARLGIGQTNSGSGRGLCALEGLVAAIEFFDIFMTSVNLPTPQSPQKESRSLISHILHIAASPPDDAKRPHRNTMHYLDSVSWDSIPAELRKRKINLSLISLTKIPLFQDLQSSVAGSMAQPPWFNVHSPHVLSLAGFPAPQKTSIKRQPDASDQSPDTKRQKIAPDSTSKRSSASPALLPARIPQNQRPQQSVPPQVAPPPPPPPPSTTTAGPNPTSTQPVQTTPTVPASTATTTSTVQPPPSGLSMTPEFLEQNVEGIGLTFGQVMEHLRVLDRDITGMEEQISHLQNAGQTMPLAQLQKERASKVYIREQVKMRLRLHYQKTYGPKEAPNPQAGGAASTQNPATEAGPSGSSAQSHPSNASNPSSEKPPGPTIEESKPPVLSDTQITTNLRQSRSGTLSVPPGDPSAGPNQAQPQPTPEVVAQTQNSIEKKGISPLVAGPSSQASGTPSQDTGVNSTAMPQPVQSFNPSTWIGTLSLVVPKSNNNGQGASEMQLQIHVIGMYTTGTPSDIRTDHWPKNLVLSTCKEPLKDATELPAWLKRHQPRSHVMQFRPNPRVPDAPLNEQKFQGLKKHMMERRMFAYTGWQLPSGKISYNIVIFPIGPSFAGAVFPDGIPDLPGSGNALESQPLAPDVKPLAFNAPNLPPALKARLQGLEPAKQKQLLAQWIRAQQEYLRRQQLQQTQQGHNASGQALNTLGMSIPPNMYNTIANIPAGLQFKVNANAPMNAGSYNTAGGTVNHEMMQSFMQRNAEGSTSASQGMNPS